MSTGFIIKTAAVLIGVAVVLALLDHYKVGQPLTFWTSFDLFGILKHSTPFIFGN